MDFIKKTKKIAKILTRAREDFIQREKQGVSHDDFIIATENDAKRAKDIAKRINHIELSILSKRQEGDSRGVDELSSALKKIHAFAYTHFKDLFTSLEKEIINNSNPTDTKNRRDALEKSLEVLHA